MQLYWQLTCDAPSFEFGIRIRIPLATHRGGFMLLKHAGLPCSTEENADKFYRDLLGLNKSEPKTLPSDLSKTIFNLDAELLMINYYE